MKSETRFAATYETIRAGEAIVELTLNGEWQGGGLVAIRSTDPAALYEACYRAASASAAAKGGALDRFSAWEAPRPAAPDFKAFSDACPAVAKGDYRTPERRPVNGLNVEFFGSGAGRCIDMPPAHWPAGMGLRWLASGGSPLVFGTCCAALCPRRG